jgi:DNA-binding transcriptional LysR family regulator
MNLNQLRFASSVAATASFTAAAEQCCVTQPTLSNGIALLEDELGNRLFDRTTRKVSLTPFGESVLPYIHEVLRAQDSLIQQARVFLQPETQLIRIGTSPLISANLLGLMMEPFRLRNPTMEVVLREMNMTDLARMLEAGLLDFVLGVAGTHKGAWASTHLYSEPLIYIPRGAVWPQGDAPRAVQLKDIADETFVMVPDACGLARTTRALFRSQRRKLQEYSGEAMSYQVLEQWAALGIGAAILPRSKISTSKGPRVPIIDKAGHEVTLNFEATWSRTNTSAPHLLDFANHLRKVAPEIIRGLGASAKR